MLYNGELTCQTQSGKLNKLVLTVYGEDSNMQEISKEDTLKGLEQALSMRRFVSIYFCF